MFYITSIVSESVFDEIWVLTHVLLVAPVFTSVLSWGSVLLVLIVLCVVFFVWLRFVSDFVYLWIVQQITLAEYTVYFKSQFVINQVFNLTETQVTWIRWYSVRFHTAKSQVLYSWRTQQHTVRRHRPDTQGRPSSWQWVER